MTRTRDYIVAIAAVFAVAAGCSTGPETDPRDEQQEAEAVAREIGQVVVEAGGAVTALGAPMASALRDDTAGTGGLRTRIERSISESVVSAGCVSLSWASWSATVDFDECRIPEVDARLDGAVTLAVRPLKRMVIVDVDDLAIGAHTFYGSMSVQLRGLIGSLTFGVDADLTLADKPATLVADGLDVELTLAGMTVSGEGAVMSPTVDATASLAELHWVLGDCLPSSGTISFVDGAISGTITFLETTPETGKVRLKVPLLPAAIVTLLPACP